MNVGTAREQIHTALTYLDDEQRELATVVQAGGGSD